MLGFFGRLEKAVWLEQTVGVFRQPWFWGDTSREVRNNNENNNKHELLTF
jgi:hypothetical protein